MNKAVVLLAVALSAALPARAVAQTPNAASGTTLITLGTRGGPLPTKDRAQSSNLLIVNGTLYLIDAGDGVTRRIVQTGNDFRKVGKIFITHPHSDHDNGLATLLNSEWEYQRAEPIDIYGGGVEALVRGAIDYLTPNADIRWSEGKKRPMADVFHGHDVSPGVIYQDANVKVTAVENTHFHFQPGDPAYGKYHSYSYRFDTPDKVVFFTGDTGPSDAVVELARGADLYVTECTSPDDVVALFKKTGAWQAKTPAEQEGFLRHMHEEHVTPEDIGKMAAKAGVKAVVMTHLGPTPNPNDDYQRYVDGAKKYYSGPIILAKDLMKF
ncbi:MAG TPA: MBL fold metallo-hydrolase [Xanthobacteraceae bacterium]|jgi:ribonuclease BN (tRNA processing enzyme)|nr:MBL fold metallo-hydrolase [Xanthobacteraceae bacterium]